MPVRPWDERTVARTVYLAPLRGMKSEADTLHDVTPAPNEADHSVAPSAATISTEVPATEPSASPWPHETSKGTASTVAGTDTSTDGGL